MIRTPLRSGAALILAIILLAGLLLLGLPFLFSQSASLAGTRSLAYQQQATVGRDAAEHLGMAVGAEMVRDRFLSAGVAAYSSFDDMGPTPLVERLYNTSSYALLLDQAPLVYNGAPANARTLGTILTDEHGKLDVNHLDVAAWHRLLSAVGIEDWDDSLVWDSDDPNNDPAGDQYGDGQFDDDGMPGRNGDANLNGDNDDVEMVAGTDQRYGELAEALALLRFSLPHQRIASLDQLLLADTGHHADAEPNATDYTNNSAPLGRYGLRRPLTRAELDLLRPHLTVHVLGQGRQGLIDLGSTIAVHPNNGSSFFDSDLSDVVRPGTVLAWQDGADLRYDVYRSFAALTAAQGIYVQGAVNAVTTPAYAANRAFAISAPLPVNLHHAAYPVRVALRSVDGLAASVRRYGDLPADPANTLFSTKPYHFLDPLFTGRELPPIGIGSFGTIQIDSAAVANDPQARSAAQRRRRAYAQAVPQETALEQRWVSQGQLHALTAARAGSQVDTWPQPMRRVQDIRPDETVHDPVDTTPVIGVRPATMPSLASGWNNRRDAALAQRRPTHLDVDWKLAFGADGAVSAADVVKAMDVDSGQLDDLAVTGANFTAADLRPDGLHVAPGRRLAAVLRSAGGGTIPGPLRAVDATTADLRGRHLSFWIKPDVDLSDAKLYPLLETRIPAGSAGNQMDGTRGFSDLQNYLGLFYDRPQQLLVLVIAPPTIEHTVDSWLNVPEDDASLPLTAATTYDIDERCLAGGNPAWLPLAPRLPYPDSSGAPLAPWVESGAKYTTFATRLLKPNRAVHLYKVSDVTGAPFFRGERWHHVQLVLAGDRPGLARVLVDNVAGRDVSRTPPTSVAAMAHGDHLALPALPLDVALAMADPATDGGDVLRLASLVVRPALGLTAADLFPARGMLRIDDEYISYEAIAGNTFLRCVRGRRQNTQVDDAGNPVNRWPNTQQHLAGALVTQGGYRLGLNSGTILYRGGCTLKEGLPNGDPAAASAYQWHIWARPQTTVPPFVQPNPAEPVVTWPGSTVDRIPLQPGVGVPAQFPANGGIIWFQNHLYFYATNTGAELQGLVALTGWTSEPARSFLPMEDIAGINRADPLPIRLAGIELDTAVDAFDPGRYDFTSNGDDFLLQLQHPGPATAGRVEWIRYENFIRAPSGRTFVINEQGWTPLSRGQQRTDFRGRLNTHLTDADVFPPGTSVLPVQTNLGTPGHWVATGDVVTLRRRPGTLTTLPPPVQLLVRYAAADGYGPSTPIAPSSYDTKNDYFAFDRPIPDGANGIPNDPAALPLAEGLHAGNYELLCGNCWSAEDLTPMSPSRQRRGHLPRIDLLAGTAPAALYIGSADATSIATELADLEVAGMITPADVSAYAAARELGLSATIDAVVSGDLAGITDTAQIDGVGIRRGLTASGADLFSGIGTLGEGIEATSGIFDRAMGLIAVDGEVFAYRRINATQATIVGRGLLDQHAALGVVHDFPSTGPSVSGNIVRPIMPAVPLPIGPVAMVGDAIASHDWFRFVTAAPIIPTTSGVDFDAPAVLLCSPNGDPTIGEMVLLAGPTSKTGASPQPREGTFYTTAPWLRGVYNTPAGTAGSVGQLAIGWWPRYPSALPAAATDEHFRSRAFSWIGFPYTLYRAHFSQALLDAAFGTAAAPPVAEVSVQDTGTSNLFTLQAHAAATGFGWSTLPGSPLAGLGANDVGAAFAHPQFAGPVDGAELRVTWHYAVPPSPLLDAIANAANRAPMLGSARIRALAPALVLAVEDAR